MDTINRPDYSLKNSISPDLIAQLYQKKGDTEHDDALNQRKQNFEAVKFAVNETNKAVTGMIELSRERQKKAFVTSLADSLAASGALKMGGQGQSTMTPTPTFGTAAFNPNESDALRSATMINPAKASELVLKSAMPAADHPAVPRGNQFDIKSVIDPQTQTAMVVRVDKVNNLTTDLAGRAIPPDVLSRLQPTYAPQLVETPSGPKMVPKMPGAIETAAPSDPAKGKSTIEQFSQPEVKRIETIKNSLEGDKVYQTTNTKDMDLQLALSAVDTENWVGDATILSLLAKGLGRDVGNLSAPEQERYRTSPEIIRRIKTHANRWIDGKITETDRSDIREAIRIMQEKNAAARDRRVDLYVNQAKRATKNANPDFLRSYIFEPLPPETEAGSPQATTPAVTQTRDAVNKAIDLGNGFTYEVLH